MITVTVMQIIVDKVGCTLDGIWVYLMHKAYRVDIMVDLEGTKVARLATERYFNKDSPSTLGSKVNSKVVE